MKAAYTNIAPLSTGNLDSTLKDSIQGYRVTLGITDYIPDDHQLHNKFV